MAQLVCMDACLDTLSDELCLVNTHIGCIAPMTGYHGGFTIASSLSPLASNDEGDDCFSSDNVDDDGLPSDDEMST